MSAPADLATLRDLRDRVRATTDGSDRELDARIYAALEIDQTFDHMARPLSSSDPLGYEFVAAGGQRITGWSRNAYSATETAALGLVERILPRWRWVCHSPRKGLSFGCSLAEPKAGGIVAVAEDGNKTAPLAILAALLAALIAHAEAEEGTYAG